MTPSAAGARRPAHRVGQEHRLLDGDPAPARPRRRPDAHHHAAPVAHAQPARDGRPARPPPVTINSSNREDWQDIRRALASATRSTLLLVSPERLANDDFMRRASCRRSGRRSASSSSTRSTASPTGVTTSVPTTGASGHPRHAPDVHVRARRRPPPPTPASSTTSRSSSAARRSSCAARSAGTPLRSRSCAATDQAERLAWLVRHLPTPPGSGIVYCLTIADVERRGRVAAPERHRRARPTTGPGDRGTRRSWSDARSTTR